MKNTLKNILKDFSLFILLYSDLSHIFLQYIFYFLWYFKIIVVLLKYTALGVWSNIIAMFLQYCWFLKQ